MKLWSKEDNLDKKVEKFTVGSDRLDDLHLAKYDVIASIAHAEMLSKCSIITKDDENKLVDELKNILKEIEKGNFTIEDSFEDVHSKIEYLLIKNLGDIGKKIHTGRSRNDQVLVATQLFLKEEINIIKKLVKSLFDILIEKANSYKDKYLPGYTHLQVAMPSTFGLWFSAYAESLIDDIIFLNTALKINDQNPLGSAAGYGSSIKIDRTYTTKKLGFETLKFNVFAAQMGRGRVEKSVAVALSSLATTLAKFSSDICFYMTNELNFVSFPENFTTGSSIMPHKKNPDVFELIRAKCNQIKSVSNQFDLISSNLTSGYHRDMQLYKGVIINSIASIKDCLEILSLSLDKVKVRNNILADEKYKFINSVDMINNLIQNENMSFRDAYLKISTLIKEGKFDNIKTNKQTLIGSIHNLCLDKIQNKMNNFY